MSQQQHDYHASTEADQADNNDDAEQQQQQQQQQPSYQDVECSVEVIDIDCEMLPEPSVTAAEPIDDDDFLLLDDDAAIPTIRLSTFGTILETDFAAVQAEFGGGNNRNDNDDDNRDGCDNNLHKNGSNGSNGTEQHVDEEMGDMSQRYYDADDGVVPAGAAASNGAVLNIRPTLLQKAALKTSGLPTTEGDDEDSTSLPSSSEEILVDQASPLPLQPFQQQQQSSLKPNRQRVVSEDGIIAEFGDPSSDDDNARVVAEAVEIDSSFRSLNDFNDLELGDEEPLPYPGRRSSFTSLRDRALGRSNPTGSGSNGGATSSGSRRDSRRGGAGMLRSATGQYARPELVSATVIKNSQVDQIGISLLSDDTVVYQISREDDSLLKDCPFQAGDRLLSINNKRTEHMDSAEAARLLREVTGFITIVVQNPPGDPSLIETMITKANKNQRSGMGLKSTGDQDLRVSSINENGLFAQSLLNIGDRILSINNVDVTEVDARVACDIIKNAATHVTVVARSRHTHGVVVAEVSTRGLNTLSSADNVLTSVPEATTVRNNNEIEAVDDTCSMSKRQREQLMIAACLGIILIAVLLGVFSG